MNRMFPVRTIMKPLKKAKLELGNGRPWRAKEILRGAIGQSPFDTELYKTYGELLLSLGDLPEAGKYLFLSGSAEPMHEEAVAEFLRRWGRSGPELLYSRFPSRARLQSISDYPPTVRKALAGDFTPPAKVLAEQCCQGRWQGCRDAIAVWGCGLVVFIIAILLGFGIRAVFQLVTNT
nr:putative integron gene cassette protein [uncultured bacterium]